MSAVRICVHVMLLALAVACDAGRRGRRCVSHRAVWSLTAVTSLDWSDKNECCDAILFVVKPESCPVVQSGV